MADLDHLKQINDQFGHHEGDFALKAVADILRQAICAEEGETGADSRQKPLQVLGRIGGDEFICCSVHTVIDNVVKLLAESPLLLL